jgi:uncharacterized protein
MTILDWCYVALIASGLLIDHFVNWPAFLRRSELDPHSARLWLWRGWMILLWTLVVVGVALWLANERAWSALGFTLPHGWRLWASVAPVVGFALHEALTAAKVARIAGPKPKLRAQFGELVIILPRSLAELRWFTAASLTAGFCEEFLFRGYLIWAFAPLLGWWGAAALSLAAFAAGHTYQGKAGFIRSALAGGVFTALVVLFGSLVPAIALHALIDAGGGVIAWLVLREGPVNAVLAGAGETS